MESQEYFGTEPAVLRGHIHLCCWLHGGRTTRFLTLCPVCTDSKPRVGEAAALRTSGSGSPLSCSRFSPGLEAAVILQPCS